MESLVVVFTLLASVGLGLVAAYLTLSIPLLLMQRAMMPPHERHRAAWHGRPGAIGEVV
jgi:hypothetical protein